MARQQSELHSLLGAGWQGRWLQMCSPVLEMLGYLGGWRRSQRRTALPPYTLVVPEQAQWLCLCGYHAGELFWWRKTGEEEKGRGCEALLSSASQSSFRKVLLREEPGCFSSWNADKSLGKAMLEAVLFPRWPWAKAQLSFLHLTFSAVSWGYF